jgi:hypothetical protein
LWPAKAICTIRRAARADARSLGACERPGFAAVSSNCKVQGSGLQLFRATVFKNPVNSFMVKLADPMKRQLATVAAFLTLSACATSEGPPAPAAASAPRPGSAAFSVSDFVWSTNAGKGQIDGQVVYSDKDTAFSCAAAGVILTPETPWVRRRMKILYNSENTAALPAGEVRKRTPPERSQDYSKYVRRTTCDAAGRFSFSGLPDGAWFVITVVRPIKGGAGQEIALMRRVTTKGERPVKVRL